MNIDLIARISEDFSTIEKFNQKKGVAFHDTLERGKSMKIFTNEFEDLLAKVIVHGLAILIPLLVIGIVGGIEQGLIFP